MVKVTVLISYYNYKDYVYETIKSIFNQTFKDFELLVINEGNPNDFIEIKKEFPKLKVLTKKDEHNLSKVWNYGIKNAKGKYIKVIDSDDILLPNCLEEQVKILDKYEDVGLVSGHHIYKIDSKNFSTFKRMIKGFIKGKIKKLIQKDYKDFSYSCWITKDMFKKGNPISIPTTMFRKEVGFFNEDMTFGEDFEFWLRISKKWKIYRIPKKLAYYRIHGNQQTAKDRWKENRNILNKTKKQIFGDENVSW